MLSELETKNKVVGLKQSKKAVSEGKAAKVFLAHDAGTHIRRDVALLCGEKGVEIEAEFSMEELGSACGVEVNAAVAAILISE